jgi:hypothetical protein
MIGEIVEIGVFRCTTVDERFSDEESKRDDRVVMDGC